MKSRHIENCSAPICVEDSDTMMDAVWCPGEMVCRSTKRHPMQDIQSKLNVLFRKEKIKDDGFTGKQLMGLKIGKTGKISVK